MLASKSVRRAVHYTLLASAAAMIAMPVQAQDENIQEVVVTGSRIRIKDYEAISPVSTMTADAIKATGSLNIDQVLNALPQVVPGLSASSNNPSDGTATVDLRGLGPTRTLVLLNGRRLNPSVNDGTVDLNNIPTRLVERVEVVTGGASAVYGSDAMAGVVNFILKDDFEGVDLGMQYGQSTHGDGADYQVDFLLGGNFADDRGNMTGFASFYKRESVLQSARDVTRINIDDPPGSATGEAGRLDNLPGNPFATGSNRAFNTDGSVRPFVNTLDATDGGDRYNFPPVNYLLTPAERITLGAMGHFDFSDNVQAYTELLYVDSQNSAQLAPTPATPVNVYPDSPLLSPSAQALLAARPDPDGVAIFRRRMSEVGARLQENRSKLEEITVGLRGDLGVKDFEYDAFYQFGRTEFVNYTTNDVSRSRFEAGIAGCPADYIRFQPDCVPVNPFGLGNISAAAADFIRLNFTDTLVFERNTVGGSINGTLFEMPAGPLGFAVGAEWREDSSSFTPDKSKEDGDILGFNAQQPIDGEFNVKELYFEAIVPLLRDLPAVQSLSMELGARYSDYSSIGDVVAYKGGLDWKPIDSLRFRGMYQRANRAPSVFELFQAGDQGFPQYTDPCAELVPADDPATAAFCAQQGIPDTESFIQNNVQVETFFYGNPDLQEETSDTYTIGLVFTPEFASGLSVSVDYWSIKVEDYINTLAGGAQGIIDGCFAAQDLTSAACFDQTLGVPLIYRDASGELKVNAPTVNVSELETAGVDLQLNYMIPVGKGLSATMLLTYLDKYVLDGIDYKGSSGGYNILGSFPEYKANLRLSYPFGPVTVNYNLQYINAMINQGNIPDFGDDSDYLAPPTYFYHDVSAVWNINDSYELSVGVRNIEDKDPPLITFGVDQNGDPSTYDMLGRFAYGSFRMRF
ncbi:TonB-dependent receptor [Povalibacter sp.]|uniref:TonB-dependent receptor plug domain-containing protein n=1 Tax=Povalibacter sp. TaxID=1962978 RepID=UPI002F3F3CE3